jgi:2'-5' RNA ligase
MPIGSVKWVRPEGIHLTLKFLGDTRRERLRAIEEGMRNAAESVERFQVELVGAGCFPSCRRPRVLWVGIGASETLLRLQQRIDAEMNRLGWAVERRPFNPHLTLGRVRRDAPPSEVRRIGEVVSSIEVGSLGVQQVTEVSLIRSILRRDGARYVKLFSAKLRG